MPSPPPPTSDIDGDNVTGPPGAPDSRPRECWRYISRDAAISNTETSLRFSVVAQTRCGSFDIPAEDARAAIAAAAGVRPEDLLLRHFYPENFIILCGSQEIKDQVLVVSPLPIGSTALVLRPWTKLRHAEASTLRYRVNIVLEGIPPHAWREDTAAKILTPSCWIQEIDNTTRTADDLSTFKVTAWTAHPSYIPLLCWPGISEDEPPCHLYAGGPALPPYLREKKTLAYKVLIHIRSVADFNPRSPSPRPGGSPPSDADSSGLDDPDDGYHFSRGSGPRIHAFACDRGIPDGDADYGSRRHGGRGSAQGPVCLQDRGIPDGDADYDSQRHGGCGSAHGPACLQAQAARACASAGPAGPARRGPPS